ncbi:MAG: hypothetical protein UR81_C0031G0009 [Candidatus Levybacteria bacterium GW2011_GWB1_35_5]|nr:MAG: hypothetical protein UR81_C0031G0009 [Candidatus Levybacteria bacterium GW2011_GWB1_35_5]
MAVPLLIIVPGVVCEIFVHVVCWAVVEFGLDSSIKFPEKEARGSNPLFESMFIKANFALDVEVPPKRISSVSLFGFNAPFLTVQLELPPPPAPVSSAAQAQPPASVYSSS